MIDPNEFAAEHIVAHYDTYADPSIPTADLLDAAADLIEEHGLTKNSFGSETKGFCALGAIREVSQAHQSGEFRAITDTPTHVLMEFLGGAVTLWNDDPDRTKEEVVQALRDAATKQRMK